MINFLLQSLIVYYFAIGILFSIFLSFLGVFLLEPIIPIELIKNRKEEVRHGKLCLYLTFIAWFSWPIILIFCYLNFIRKKNVNRNF